MMKMNPICERAARAAARTPRFSAALFGGNALLAALALFMLGLTGELRYAEMLRIFHTLVWAELILAALLVPARAAGAVSGEREQRTLDLLLGTALSPRRIILGNLLQNLVGAGIFALSGLPVLLTALLFGGVSLADVALLCLGILFSAALSGSLGLFFSATNRTTAVAIVETYAAEALLFLAPFGILLLTKGFLADSLFPGQSDGESSVSRDRASRFRGARRKSALTARVNPGGAPRIPVDGTALTRSGARHLAAPQKT